MLLNQFHPAVIHLLYKITYFSFSVKRLIIEVSSPMTKVTGNHKYCVLVIKIRSKSSSYFVQSLLIQLPHNYRNHLSCSHSLTNVRHVHLQTVLLLFVFLRQSYRLQLTFEFANG